jgi:hypothetical protein
MKKGMHGLAVFWIYAGMVVSAMAGITSICILLWGSGIPYIQMGSFWTLASSVVGVVSGALLRGNKIFGLWLGVCSYLSLLLVVLNSEMALFVYFQMWQVGWLLVLFGLLRLKKNGVSAWSLMKKTCDSCANKLSCDALEKDSRRCGEYKVAGGVEVD